jgi:hypothetical protein
MMFCISSIFEFPITMATKRERLIQRYFRSNTMKTTRASQQNTGFGTNANNYGGRFINKDGTANVEKRGCFSYTASVGTTL